MTTLPSLAPRYLSVALLVLFAIALFAVLAPGPAGAQDGTNPTGEDHGTGPGDGTGNPCADHAPGVAGCPEETPTPTPTPADPPTPTPTPRPTATPTPSGGLPLPSTPRNFRASSNSCDTVALSWNFQRHVLEFEINYRVRGSSSWSSKFVDGPAASSGEEDGPTPTPTPTPSGPSGDDDVEGATDFTTITGLRESTEYEFRISAYGDGVRLSEDGSPWSGIRRATTTACERPPDPTKTPTPTPTVPALAAPPAPTELEGEWVSLTTAQPGVSLSWSSRDGIAKEQIRYRVTGGSWSDPVTADITVNISGGVSGAVDTVSSLIRGLDPLMEYQFQVRSRGDGMQWADEWGDWSSTETVPPVPPAPSGFVAESVDQRNILLKWLFRESTVDQIRYRVEETEAWTRVNASPIIFGSGGDAPGEPVEYTSLITNLQPCTTYEFQVRSFGDGEEWAAGWGPWTATKEASTDGPALRFNASVPNMRWTLNATLSPFQLIGASGGCGKLTYTAEDLPHGTEFDPRDRTVSGRPNRARTYDVTYQVSDEDMRVAEQMFMVAVVPPKLPAPIDLTITPSAGGSEARLSWTGDPRAFGYGIQVRERTDARGRVTLGTWRYLGEVIGTTRLDISLDAVWRDRNGNAHGMADLPDNGAYEYQVRAKARPGQDLVNSEFSKSVHMRDIPMVVDGRIDETNAAKVFWAFVDGARTYELQWRKLDGGVSSGWERWAVGGLAQPDEWSDEAEPVSALHDTAKGLDSNAIYAFRLIYEHADGTGFSAREYYGWPSSRDFPRKGERVATFPFFGHWTNQTYGYVFCDETVPVSQRMGWQELIDDAADEWDDIDSILPTAERPLVDLNPGTLSCKADDNPPHTFFKSYENNVNEIFVVDLDADPDHRSGSMTERIAAQSEIDLGCTVLPTRENIVACIIGAIGQASFSPLGTIGCILVADSCTVSHNLHSRVETSAAKDPRAARGNFSVDILINARTTADSTRRPPDFDSPRTWTLDLPSVRFNTCQGSGDYSLYRMMVHEFGHALGLSSLTNDRRSGQPGALEPEPHSTVSNSVLNEIDEADCSPYPFDVLALQALYQGVP